MTEFESNPLGLSLDDSNPRERVPLIVVYGEPKVGKSTEMAKAFSRCLWITSDETVLRPYASWYASNEAEARSKGMKDPRIPYGQGGMARKTLPEFQDDGRSLFDNWKTMNVILNRYLDSVEKGNCPFDGLVIDEFSTIAARVWQNMRAAAEDPKDSRFKTKYGKPDHYGPPREIIEWCNWVCAIPRAKPGRGAKMLGLICHPEDPQPNDGVKGGPKLPTVKSRRTVCARADAILRIFVEKLTLPDSPDDIGLDEGTSAAPQLDVEDGEYVSAEGLVRRIQTEINPLWEGGFRDFGVKPKVKLDLRDLLEGAGFVL